MFFYLIFIIDIIHRVDVSCFFFVYNKIQDLESAQKVLIIKKRKFCGQFFEVGTNYSESTWVFELDLLFCFGNFIVMVNCVCV